MTRNTFKRLHLKANIDAIIDRWASGVPLNKLIAEHHTSHPTLRSLMLERLGPDGVDRIRRANITRSNRQCFLRTDVAAKLDAIVERFKSGETVSRLAAENTITWTGLKYMLVRRLGQAAYDAVAARSRHRRRTARRPDLADNIDTILTDYRAGATVADLCKIHRCGSITLRKTIVEAIGENGWHRLKRRKFTAAMARRDGKTDIAIEAGHIVYDYEKGASINALVKKYHHGASAIALLLVDRLGIAAYERLFEAHRRARRAVSAKTKHTGAASAACFATDSVKTPAQLETRKAELNAGDRVFWMCAGCGHTCPEGSTPPPTCVKCGTGAYEQCTLPRRLTV